MVSCPPLCNDAKLLSPNCPCLLLSLSQWILPATLEGESFFPQQQPLGRIFSPLSVPLSSIRPSGDESANHALLVMLPGNWGLWVFALEWNNSSNINGPGIDKSIRWGGGGGGCTITCPFDACNCAIKGLISLHHIMGDTFRGVTGHDNQIGSRNIIIS